jgi:hypothetical protein
MEKSWKGRQSLDITLDADQGIARLPDLDLSALRARWRALKGRDAPQGFRRSFLILALAHEDQAQVHGGLNATMRRRLRLLASAARGERFEEALGVSVLRPGTVLVRMWEGIPHHVMVCDKGFVWSGQPYRSLSAIAKAITGSSWNGWAFFGLSHPTRRNANASGRRVGQTRFQNGEGQISPALPSNPGSGVAIEACDGMR